MTFKEFLVCESRIENSEMLFRQLFPNAHVEKTYNRWVGTAEMEGRELKVTTIYGKDNRIGKFILKAYIAFYNTGYDVTDMYGQSKEVRPGSVDFASRLKQLIKGLVDLKACISYVPSDNKRANIYANWLSRMGLKPTAFGGNLLYCPD